MPIPIPVTRTKIATASWGIPITNEVNRLTPLVDTHQTDIAALETLTAVGTWQTPVYSNGWGAHSASHPFKYRKVGEYVEFRGVISGGALGGVITTLPAGYRPPFDMGWPCYTGQGQICPITVEANGVVTPQVQGVYGGFVYMDPVRFSVTP